MSSTVHLQLVGCKNIKKNNVEKTGENKSQTYCTFHFLVLLTAHPHPDAPQVSRFHLLLTLAPWHSTAPVTRSAPLLTPLGCHSGAHWSVKLVRLSQKCFLSDFVRCGRSITRKLQAGCRRQGRQGRHRHAHINYETVRGATSHRIELLDQPTNSANWLHCHLPRCYALH